MATLPENEDPAIYSPKWADDCSTCKDIWHHFADPETAPDINLGTYEKALATTCPNHRPFVQSFVDFLNSVDDLNKDYEMVLNQAPKGFPVAIASEGGYVRFLLLVKKDNVNNHPGNGRLLDPDFADLETVKKWKLKCVSSHGPKCDNPLKVWPVRPAWLIDVQNQCIVPGHTTGTYVAISYTYGKYSRPTVTSSDFTRLQEPFALTASEFSNLISPIIRYAMRMTSIIEERFLWADSLCITHHDPKTASEQLKLMGAIYANAIVTIVAADGDSESGLSGLQGTSGPREATQDIIPFGDETIVVRNTYHLNTMGYFASRPQPYYHRGWTFQEYALSKRKIIFCNDELHWVCACSLWHEELTLHTQIDDELTSWSDALMAGFPHELCISRYLETYNRRLLTFEEDALPAISGLLSVFSRSFEGGFLYGIPEMFFEHSLGWRVLFDNLERRSPSGRPVESQFASSGLPSWSWLGWKGLFHQRCQTAIEVNNRVSRIEEAFPITDWYTSDLPSGPPEQRRRIQSTWYQRRDTYKDFTRPMPPGWTRRDVTVDSSTCNKTRLYPDGCDKYVFQHESMPECNGEPLEWYYPFPVLNIQESTPPSMPKQTRYLFCETVTATLYGFREDEDKLRHDFFFEVNLFDRFGTKVGTLDPVNEESRDRFPKYTNGSEGGLAIDLVAVCRLKVNFRTFNQQDKSYSDPKAEDTYLVLWVEWEDGIAYRVASGEVKAEEWEKLDLKTVSLVLG
ncbi:hypothetical protein NW768_011255 [Fusarium equiseti]|uniref:Heterokaryon incompatibility domain-containing protein n=1 Tax=Fusarium equiseti TaxID=61235 RepID=A0ABQ8QYB8_FUSEQ|nr:hypothetical protein NW768_011255 [Fusarium equiseti]